MTLVVAACAVCGGRDFRPVYRGTVGEGDLDPAPYFSSSRSSAGHFPVVRCIACGLWMANPRDDHATLARTYADLKDRVYEEEEENRERTAEEHFRFMTRHQPCPGRLLDAGCATGAFARVATRAGWKTSGVDASAWALDLARERCRDATFVLGLIEEVEFPASSFDVITLWDTLEHVSAPAKVLARARSWLTPGGWLFLNVPNADSWTARAMGRRWILLLREHLWYFTPLTLQALLSRCGFQCVETRPNRVRFSAAAIARRLAQYPAGRWAGPVVSLRCARRLALRFPIGEINAAARRIAD